METLLALGSAAAMGVAAMGGGAALLHAFAPTLLQQRVGWFFAFGVGVGAHSAWACVSAATGLLSATSAFIGLLVLASGWLRCPPFPRPRASGGHAAWLWALLLTPAIVLALAPPTDTDEIYQHLALARRIAETGSFLGGFDAPDGSRPQGVHALLASAYALGGAEAARFWHLGIATALLVGGSQIADAKFGPGRGFLPATVLAASTTFAHEAGLAYNDLPAAMWLLLAAHLATEKQDARTSTLVGAFLGLALTAKYTAAPAATAVGLVCLWNAQPRRRLVTCSTAAGAGLLVLAPWWLRNVAEGLHPLFPYAGWPAVDGFRFVYAEKYGIGHTWLDAARLPFDVIFRSRLDTFAFLGQLSWGWAPLLAGAAWACRKPGPARPLVFVLAAGLVGWGCSAQVMRYLLPLAGVALVVGAASPWRVATVCFALMSIPKNQGPLLAEAEAAWPVATRQQTEDAWLQKEMPAWGALSYLRDHVPPESPVALLYAWQGYWVGQPWRLGSVEDHTPTRQWIATHGDRALLDLYAQGVRWLLVGDVRFLRKSYAFLPEGDWRSQFVEPREQLTRLLARDAERVYAARHWEVYRLDAAAAGD